MHRKRAEKRILGTNKKRPMQLNDLPLEIITKFANYLDDSSIVRFSMVSTCCQEGCKVAKLPLGNILFVVDADLIEVNVEGQRYYSTPSARFRKVSDTIMSSEYRTPGSHPDDRGTMTTVPLTSPSQLYHVGLDYLFGLLTNYRLHELTITLLEGQENKNFTRALRRIFPERVPMTCGTVNLALQTQEQLLLLTKMIGATEKYGIEVKNADSSDQPVHLPKNLLNCKGCVLLDGPSVGPEILNVKCNQLRITQVSHITLHDIEKMAEEWCTGNPTQRGTVYFDRVPLTEDEIVFFAKQSQRPKKILLNTSPFIPFEVAVIYRHSDRPQLAQRLVFQPFFNHPDYFSVCFHMCHDFIKVPGQS